MAKSRDYNPKGAVVVKKARGLKIGGKSYAQGEVISDDCISLRKRMQLYKQNFICHPWEVEKAPVVEAETDQKIEVTTGQVVVDQETDEVKTEEVKVDDGPVVDETPAVVIEAFTPPVEVEASENEKPESDVDEVESEEASDDTEADPSESDDEQPEVPTVGRRRLIKDDSE